MPRRSEEVRWKERLEAIVEGDKKAESQERQRLARLAPVDCPGCHERLNLLWLELENFMGTRPITHSCGRVLWSGRFDPSS